MPSRWLSSGAQFCAITFVLLHSVDACQPNCQSTNCLPSCSLIQPSACAAKQFQPTGPATDRDLLRLLGGSTSLRDLHTSNNGREVISRSSDLDCVGPDSGCRWRNAAPKESIDDFDWGYGEGTPDADRWSLLTGSDILPRDPFFLTGSSLTDPERSAALLSDVIGCQEADGRLSFKYWTSRSRLPGREPTITVCYKYTHEETLVDCQLVTSVGIHPKTASVIIHGPIVRPFQLAITAEHFVNEPEGGFVVIGEIQHEAEVKESCGASGNANDDNDEEDRPVPVGGDLELLRPNHPLGVRSRANDIDDRSSLSIRTLKPSKSADIDSCKLLACDFPKKGNFCRLNPTGLGANGIGERVGWQVLPVKRNPTNPLTGIHAGFIKSPDGPFAIAVFPDPRQEPEEENLLFSLESAQLHFTETHYLTFKKYLATAGVQLLVCSDPNAHKCFWRSAPLEVGARQAQRNRAWTTELIQIPEGSYKLFLLARYDGSQRFNAGQIGLGYIRLFRDSQMKTPLC